MARVAGLGWRAGVAAAVSVLVTAAVLVVALMAASGARAAGRELSARLVPAAGAAGALLDRYAAEQAALRDYVTSGQPAALAEFQEAASAIPGEQARLARLADGYPLIPASVTAAGSAIRVWRARVAGPQLGAAGRGDFARARALQGDITLTRPYTLAVRTRVAAVQAQITGRQALVTGRLISGQRALLWALAAVCAVVAVITAGSMLVVRRWLLAPFTALRTAADRVAAGSYDTQVPAGGPAELADLGRSTELMRTRLVAALAGAEQASDAMPRGGKLTIDTANITVDDTYAADRPGLQPGHYARLRVSDTGSGMDPEVAARVFEPFYTTKPPGQGTGLGLATVHGIITRAGGYAEIYSEPGLGTTVTALLPVTDQAADTAPAPAPAAAPARGHGETILVTEDEESLAALVHRLLVRNGYLVCAATSPDAALRQASDLQQPIDLLLTDAVMPGMLGNEVAARVRALRPGLPVLYMSGYAQPVLDTQGALEPHIDLLEKPFSEVTLLSRVRQALDHHPEPGPHEPPRGPEPG